ncbi:MAG: YHS domain-containing protein [Thermoplasmatota archaeon]
MGMLDKMRGASGTSAMGKGSPSGTAEDPVCHMKIDPAKAAGKSQHGPDTFYFCSAGCKQKFDADPHRYLGAHHHHS